MLRLASPSRCAASGWHFWLALDLVLTLALGLALNVLRDELDFEIKGVGQLEG